MFVIETASRACKITILIKRLKFRKVNHAFLPEGIQIEEPNPGLLPCLMSQLALLAELINNNNKTGQLNLDLTGKTEKCTDLTCNGQGQQNSSGLCILMRTV